MRRLIIAALAVIVLAAGGAAAWKFLRPRDQLAEARQLMNQGDGRAAQLVLRGIVKADPARAEAWLRLGQVQLQMGDPVAAESDFLIARERGWNAQAVAPLLAQAIVAQNRYDEVLRDFRPDGLEPDAAAAILVARAGAQIGLRQPEAAAASVAEAQRLAPKSVDTAMAAARIAVASGNRAVAMGHIDEALALDPRRLDALMMQAELRAGGDDRPAALASFTAALEQARLAGQPRAEEMIRIGRANLLLAMDDTAGARADIDAVLKAAPRNPLANMLSARLLARARDWKGADAALATVGPVLPRLPGASLLQALVKINLDQPEQAIAAAEQQVQRAPNDLAAVKLLARLYLAQKRPDQAAKVLAAAASPDAEVLDMMGSAYAAQGDGAKALTALTQASALVPDNTRLLSRVAAMQLSLGRADQAVLTLDHALDLTDAADAAAQASKAGTAKVDAARITPAALQNPAATAEPPAAPAGTPPAQTTPGQTTPGQPIPGQLTPAQTAAALVGAALRAGEIDHAAAALERLRMAHADPGEIAMLTGTVRLAQIDLAGARAAFEDADRMQPKVPGARLSLARVLALQGRTDDAVAMLQGLLEADRADAAALTALVNLLLQTGQPDKALSAAETAQRAAPANPGMAVGLASLYLRTGHPDQALAMLDASAKAAGNASSPPPAFLILRAQAQMALGQRPAAEQTLRTILALQPDNVVLRRQLAEMLATDKDYDGARGLLREGLARTPGNPTLTAASVAVASIEGGPAAALAQAETLARDPVNPAATTLVGDVLMNQRKYAAAAASFKARAATLPKDDPGIVTLQLRAADALAAGGDTAAASALLRDWLATHPDNAAVTLALSGYDIGAKRLPEARARLEAVLAREPNNPAALNNLAWIAQQQGDLTKAHALAARGYLLGPSPQAADTLGWILLAQNQASDATALLREAYAGQAQDPAIKYHLATALARTGQKAEAVTLLKALATIPAEGFDEKPQAARLLTELSAQ